MHRNPHPLICCLFGAILVFATGCARRDKAAITVFDQEPMKFTLLIAADIDIVKSDPNAYKFVVRALEKYGNDRIGEPDHVIISQLSGNDRPLLFQGTPQELRRVMPTQQAFRDYLVSRSDPGRRLSKGLAESFYYLLNSSSVARGGAKPVALVISSMQPAEDEDPKDGEQFIEELIRFHRGGGLMSFYFVDQRRWAWVKEQTKKAGIDWVYMEPDPYGNPVLPSFD